jgi:endogenous inhibitor of DNA gyrase (YacG/DUF329 family)
MGFPDYDDDEDDDADGECPTCGADVPYEDWLPNNWDGYIVCPECFTPVPIEDVYGA